MPSPVSPDAAYALRLGGEAAFSVEATSVRFGPGVLGEIGADAAGLGLRRVALLTDARVAGLEPVATVLASLKAAGVDAALYDAVAVEPGDESAAAARFAAEAGASLPPLVVVASNGFDVLSHAIESYTARPYTARPHPGGPAARPLYQGANPYSDIACLEAVRLTAGALEAAVADPTDAEARRHLMFAGLLAGIGFGNSGTQLPHGMSNLVSGGVRDFRAPGWPGETPLIPHGIAVIVNTPAVLRWTAEATPERHRAVLAALGEDRLAADPAILGEQLATRLIALMRATGIPNGLTGVGYGEDDVPHLAAGTYLQKRLVENAPRPVSEADLAALFRAALAYW